MEVNQHRTFGDIVRPAVGRRQERVRGINPRRFPKWRAAASRGGGGETVDAMVNVGLRSAFLLGRESGGLS